ncbi:MAG: Re/Si-specific NAD(P)(+) transhydrogenase subunit alpha [SAR202 cluster bacterium]|nr:Re/Si-specific NAD(P)(+) transhydrogenase subunit alpha [SAR202 cluster bacterium]|tara:strand:- start:817 stop:1995 length:1179 start_codon:yes stop_codon:yes gene_type:complete
MESSEIPNNKLILGIPCETHPEERMVSLVPQNVAALKELGVEVLIENNAGIKAGFNNQQYEDAGASILTSRTEIFNSANVIAQVRGPSKNPESGQKDIANLGDTHIIIGFLHPHFSINEMHQIAQKGTTSIAMELIPRITKAQNMDALSSLANLAGYKSVLLAASVMPKIFPLMMTASGTIRPAKILVLGAGVAGLQAIATAKRLGALVTGYDIRPAVKEQVESLGAKFLEDDFKNTEVETDSGYAKEMSDDFYANQQKLLLRAIAETDAVITTAAIPGKKAPILITSEMVSNMKAGSVIVDLAAETGGNCELTEINQTVNHNGVSIVGTTNLHSTLPTDASQVYSNNISNLVSYIVKNNDSEIKIEDPILKEVVVTHKGNIVHPVIKELSN